jgi:uridine kinase
MINMSRISGIEFAAFAGPTCAGTRELAAAVVARLGIAAEMLALDDYHLLPSGPEAVQAESEGPTITCWEDPDLFGLDRFVEDLDAIAHGQNISRLKLPIDRTVEDRSSGLYIPRMTNLVEGILVLADERARTYFDHKFFVGIPLDIMVERRLERRKEGSEDPWDQEAYIKGPLVDGTVKWVLPQGEPDDVFNLDGLLPTGELADQVVDLIG